MKGIFSLLRALLQFESSEIQGNTLAMKDTVYTREKVPGLLSR